MKYAHILFCVLYHRVQLLFFYFKYSFYFYLCFICFYLLHMSICTSMFHVYTDVWEGQKRALDLCRWSYERLWATYPGCRSEQQPALTLSHLSGLCISYWSSTLNLNLSISLKVWSQELGRDYRTMMSGTQSPTVLHFFEILLKDPNMVSISWVSRHNRNTYTIEPLSQTSFLLTNLRGYVCLLTVSSTATYSF